MEIGKLGRYADEPRRVHGGFQVGLESLEGRILEGDAAVYQVVGGGVHGNVYAGEHADARKAGIGRVDGLLVVKLTRSDGVQVLQYAGADFQHFRMGDGHLADMVLAVLAGRFRRIAQGVVQDGHLQAGVPVPGQGVGFEGIEAFCEAEVAFGAEILGGALRLLLQIGFREVLPGGDGAVAQVCVEILQEGSVVRDVVVDGADFESLPQRDEVVDEYLAPAHVHAAFHLGIVIADITEMVLQVFNAFVHLGGIVHDRGDAQGAEELA